MLAVSKFLAVAKFIAEVPSWEDWKREHGKSYPIISEDNMRQSVYEANLVRIVSHNAARHNWTMAVNKFADLTADEFAARYIGGIMTGHAGSDTYYRRRLRGFAAAPNATATPASVDWVAAGAVTPVKNQGQCGSCWSFSTTGAVEGAHFLKTGQLVSLSEQQLVDCSTAQGNDGCNGGLMDYAFDYIIANGGITTEANYPYTATDGTCNKAAAAEVAAAISSYKDVTPNSEAALEAAIAHQPVSVAVEADQASFQFYSSGVMTAACGTQLDHGVLAVGYGTLGGQDYYKVKNSWGADWGMSGYILLGRGAAFNPAGQCGIQMQPSYPLA